MPDHVRIREIHQREFIRARLQSPNQLRGHLARAHLRFEIVGPHVPLRWHQQTVLAREHLLPAAVEKEGHVRILLGFSRPELTEPSFGKNLRENVAGLLGRESHRKRKGWVVLSHAYKLPELERTAVELVEIR